MGENRKGGSVAFSGLKVRDDASFARAVEALRATLDVARMLRRGPVDVHVQGWEPMARLLPQRARELRAWLTRLEAAGEVRLCGLPLRISELPPRRSSLSNLRAVARPSAPPRG